MNDKPQKEMPEHVRVALNLWLSSATIHNSYKPALSDRKLVEALAEEGIKTSKSRISDWRKQYDFEKELNLHISQALSTDKDVQEMIAKSSNGAIVQKTIDDMKKNEDLEGLSYEILTAKLTSIKDKYAKGGGITNDEAKIAVQVALLTTGRKDKALDRDAAMAVAEKLSSQDAFKALIGAQIDIEPEDIQEAVIDEDGEEIDLDE